MQLLALADERLDGLKRLFKQDSQRRLDPEPLGDIQSRAGLPFRALPTHEVDAATGMPLQRFTTEQQQCGQRGYDMAVPPFHETEAAQRIAWRPIWPHFGGKGGQ